MRTLSSGVIFTQETTGLNRLAGAKGFEVLPKLWIVERPLAWLSHCRCLSKDYERLAETSEDLIYAGMIRLMVKRLAVA